MLGCSEEICAEGLGLRDEMDMEDGDNVEDGTEAVNAEGRLM